MINDPLGIFQEIKFEILKVFPESRVFAYGSRTPKNWKKRGRESKLDFDVYVANPNFVMDPTPEHLTMLSKANDISNFFLHNRLDEFGRPVKVDLFLVKSEGLGAEGVEI